jgi:metal-sulfur cluster biosynthetic enzyme
MLTRESVLEKLKPIEDPEVGLSVVDLGLIYDVAIFDGKKVEITMTLTSPGCPYGPELVGQVESAAKTIEGAETVEVYTVWDPPWNPAEMASDYAKDRLGIW